MNFQNNAFTFTIAEKKDTEAIKKILETRTFKGGIEIQNLRGDDPFVSYEKEGKKAYIFILKDNKRAKPVCMGGCIVRPALVDGEIKRAGYLIAFKIIPEYQKKILFITEMYKYVYDKTKEHVDFYYSAILEDNTSMLKMIKKKRKNMPEYKFLDNYTTYFCKTGNSTTTKFTVKKCGLSQIQDFYTQEVTNYTMTYPTLHENDLKNADFYGIYKDEILLGMGYLLDQREYKQYVVKNYTGIYKYISKIPIRLLQYPSFPKKNKPADYASMGIIVKDNNTDLAYELVRQMLKQSPKKDFIMIGLLESDPLNSIFSRIKHVKYKSRIYHVAWDEENSTQEENRMTDELRKTFMKIDCAFL